MPPAPAVRVAVKEASVPVGPVRPSADRALPVPEIDRSVAVPVLIFSAPVTTDDAPGPEATFAASGGAAFLNVMVLPLTFRVEPSWTRVPSEAEVIVRPLVTVTLPAPTDAVRPRAFRRSALPVMLRSAPVPVVKVRIPEAM